VRRIYMPRFDAVMEKGVIYWQKKEGSQVKKGEIIASVEGEKSVFDVESPIDGILRKIFCQDGEEVPVGQVIAIITEPGEEITEDLETEKEFEIKISPRARKLAEKYGVDLTKVVGSGPGGRIVEEDIIEAIKRIKAEEGPTVLKILPLTEFRKTIARRLSHSHQTIPSATLIIEVNMEKLLKLRQDLEKSLNRRISLTAFIVKAVAEALKEHPNINSSFEESSIKIFKDINIAVAIQSPKGLVAPAVFNADSKSILEISEEINKLTDNAEKGKLKPEDLRGGTFTVTNLGPYGIEAFIPIINPPQTAILAIGKISSKPVAANNQILIKPIATLTLVFDHRVVDGLPAALFLQKVKDIIENPNILMDTR